MRTACLILATRPDEGFNYKTQLNAFVRIPHSKMTEGALKKEQVPFTVNGAELVVHGFELGLELGKSPGIVEAAFDVEQSAGEVGKVAGIERLARKVVVGAARRN